MVEDAVRQFSRDVHGFLIEEYILIDATFDTNTNFAFRIEITGGANALSTTDVAITGTAREDATGDTVASDLQTTLNAAIATGDVSVSFQNFYFRFDTTNSSASTAIEVSSPDDTDYLDAGDLLGLDGTLTESSTGVFDGGFPEDCTMRQRLSNRPFTILNVSWDNYQLEKAPREIFVAPDARGDPRWYYQEGQDILITPAPTSQKILYVRYKGVADYATVGSNEVSADIPDDYHIALAYWVAAELLLESFEDKEAMTRRAKYEDKVREYRVNYANQNTALMPKHVKRLWYDWGEHEDA
jgi:hypothetical protein